MNHFEELLAQYGVTAEDCDFDYANMTEEELDAKFDEVFGCKKKKKCDLENDEESEQDGVEDDYAGCKKKKKCNSEDDETDGEDESETEEDYAGCKKKKKCDSNEESEDENETDEDYAGCKKKKKCESDGNEEFALISFKISHDDIRYGIQNLLCEMNDDFHYYVVNSVYDNYFYYEDWASGNAYKQSYKMRKDSISFNGDPIPVFREFVTQEEKDKLEDMRKNYAALKEFKEQYDTAQSKAEKESVLDSAEYVEIKDSDEFKALVDNMDKYSVDELKVKADLIFAAVMKKKFNFEAKDEKKPKSVGINFNTKDDKKKQAYSGLFDD